jgi:hypothetical protein
MSLVTSTFPRSLKKSHLPALSSKRDRVRKRTDRRREEVLSAAGLHECGHRDVVRGIEDVDARYVARRSVAGLADDGVETWRGVVLVEDKVGGVGPGDLLGQESVGDGALVSDEGETALGTGRVRLGLSGSD